MKRKNEITQVSDVIRLLILLGVFLLAFDSANLPSVHAQTPQYDSWTSYLPPSLTVTDLPLAWQTDVIAAAGTWTKVGTKFYFGAVNSVTEAQRIPFPSSSIPLAPGEVRVILASQLPAAERESVPAWTLRWPDPNQPHKLRAALVVLNDVNFANWAVGTYPSLGQKDLRSIATHELGHAIGLDHSCDVCFSDVMWPYDASDILWVMRELSDSDKQQLITRYGKAGDANGDGIVDGVDYVTWLNNYNKTVSDGHSVGDFNHDGKVDGIDYVIWLNNYGK